ncbi:MAG: HAD hydrolase-like protein, partial [Alphaproteobacteria bacterium]|nr:HAD hydrolase-like protein [Alphaproteobacteria bacterium]
MTLKRPRAILFDWDNTLVDTWPVIHSSLEKTMLALGREPWSMDEVRRKVRRSLRDSFPEVFGEGWEKARELYYGHFRGQHLEKLTPLEEAERMLGHLLDKDIHIAVVSNKTGQYLREEVSHLGWDKYFHKVVGALDTPRD